MFNRYTSFLFFANNLNILGYELSSFNIFHYVIEKNNPRKIKNRLFEKKKIIIIVHMYNKHTRNV